MRSRRGCRLRGACALLRVRSGYFGPVKASNQRPTWLIHDDPVVVKCRRDRGGGPAKPACGALRVARYGGTTLAGGRTTRIIPPHPLPRGRKLAQAQPPRPWSASNPSQTQTRSGPELSRRHGVRKAPETNCSWMDALRVLAVAFDRQSAYDSMGLTECLTGKKRSALPLETCRSSRTLASTRWNWRPSAAASTPTTNLGPCRGRRRVHRGATRLRPRHGARARRRPSAPPANCCRSGRPDRRHPQSAAAVAKPDWSRALPGANSVLGLRSRGRLSLHRVIGARLKERAHSRLMCASGKRGVHPLSGA